MDPFYGWGSTASRLDPIQGAVYFLPLSSQIFLVELCQYYQTSLSCHLSIFKVLQLEYSIKWVYLYYLDMDSFLARLVSDVDKFQHNILAPNSQYLMCSFCFS